LLKPVRRRRKRRKEKKRRALAESARADYRGCSSREIPQRQVTSRVTTRGVVKSAERFPRKLQASVTSPVMINIFPK